MGKQRVKRQRNQWRKIDTHEVDDAIEKRTREERQGLLVDGIPDADLFFVDKAADEDTATALQQGKLPRKMQARERPTRAQAILNAAHKALPVRTATGPAQRGGGVAQAAKVAGTALTAAASKRSGKRERAEQPLVDLWADEGGGGAADGGPPKKKKSHRPVFPRLPSAPAVAVEGPGCSYNPDRELHQEAVAVAVAAELRKATDRDLQPTAPLAAVDYDPETDELALLQVDAEEEPGAHGEAVEEGGAGVRATAQQKTQKDRNRDARRREAEEQQRRRQLDKRQHGDLSRLGAIEADVEAELAGRMARLARRRADAEERAASMPPRLGKQLYEPMPLQVLATLEIESAKGSLRRLKPTAVLAKDRFKSLQRRGMVEPRRPVQRKQGKKVIYIHGQRGERAEERQAEVEELKRAGQKKARAAKKAKAEGW